VPVSQHHLVNRYFFSLSWRRPRRRTRRPPALFLRNGTQDVRRREIVRQDGAGVVVVAFVLHALNHAGQNTLNRRLLLEFLRASQEFFSARRRCLHAVHHDHVSEGPVGPLIW